jgi:hypothetical protein
MTVEARERVAPKAIHPVFEMDEYANNLLILGWFSTATAPKIAVAVLNQPKIKRLFAEKIKYTGASFWITRMIINFHQIKFSATKMTQRWTGANPSFAMIPGIRIRKDPIA